MTFPIHVSCMNIHSQRISKNNTPPESSSPRLVTIPATPRTTLRPSSNITRASRHSPRRIPHFLLVNPFSTDFVAPASVPAPHSTPPRSPTPPAPLSHPDSSQHFSQDPRGAHRCMYERMSISIHVASTRQVETRMSSFGKPSTLAISGMHVPIFSIPSSQMFSPQDPKFRLRLESPGFCGWSLHWEPIAAPANALFPRYDWTGR